MGKKKDTKPEKSRTSSTVARKKLLERKCRLTHMDGREELVSIYGYSLEEIEYKRGVKQADLLGLAPALRKGSVDWWLAERYVPLKQSNRPATVENLRYSVRHLSHVCGGLPLREIGYREVTSILASIPSGPAMRNKCRTVLLELLDIAAGEDNEVKRLNSRRIRKAKETPAKIDVYSPAEMLALCLSIRPGFRPAVYLMCFAGLRASEAIGVELSDIDRNDVLHVERQADGPGPTDPELKNEQSRAAIPLAPGVVEALRNLAKKGYPLTHTRVKTHPSVTGLNKEVKRAAKARGLRALPRANHSLRHCYSTWLDDNGCPDGARKSLLRHGARDVSERYLHSQVLSDWAKRLYVAALEGEAPPMPDAVEKRPDLRKKARGEDNGRSKMTRAMAADALSRMLGDENHKPEPISALARELGVSAKALRRLRDGETWAGTVPKRMSTESIVVTTISESSSPTL